MIFGFIEKTSVTNEVLFHLNGCINSENTNIRTTEGLHVYVETPLHPQKIGV